MLRLLVSHYLVSYTMRWHKTSVHCSFVYHVPPFCHLISPIFLNRGGGRVRKGPTQVSTHWMCCCRTGGGVLARAASHRWDGQATKQQVHGRKKGLQKTDRAEGRASMRSEVHFVGVGAGRLSGGLTMAWRTTEEGKEKVAVICWLSMSINDILYWKYIQRIAQVHIWPRTRL